MCRDNSPKSIENYIDLCSLTNYDNAVMVYNETPWSYLKLSDVVDNADAHRIQTKIYKLAGWKPDVIIYIYIPGEARSHPLLGLSDEIPIFSTNAKEPHMLRNLTSIINEHQKKSPQII